MTKKFEFTLSTRYVGSEVSQIMEIEFDDDATEDEILTQVDEIYNEWISNKNYGGWNQIED